MCAHTIISCLITRYQFMSTVDSTCVWLQVLRLPVSSRTGSSNDRHGIIIHISEATEDAIVYYPATKESENVYMSWTERPIHIRECIQICTCFRIEVMVTASTISSYCVFVQPERFIAQITEGRVDGDVYIISLVKSIFSESLSHDYEVTLLPTSSPPIVDPDGWDSNIVLFPEQVSSLRYMLRTEGVIQRNPYIRYNNHIDIPNTGWGIDIFAESFVQGSMHRTCRVRGAYLCDQPGSGKTLVALRLCITKEPSSTIPPSVVSRNREYASRGTLVIVPLNLPGQWLDEIKKCYKDGRYHIATLIRSSDVRNTTMQNLLDADIVITTLSFMKACRVYNDTLNCVTAQVAKVSTKKSRALFNSIAMLPDILSPILQVVHWRRIIVDEIHEIKGRDLRILKCLRCDMFWGLTATPNLHVTPADELHTLNFMLEEFHFAHPNIFTRFKELYVRGHTKASDMSHNVELVNISEQEMRLVAHKSLEETVLVTTSLDDTVPFCSEPKQLTSKLVQSEDRSMNVAQRLIRTSVPPSFLESGPQPPLADQTIDTTSRQLYMEQTVNLLYTNGEVCPICLDSLCSAVTACGHLFCLTCIRTHLVGGHQNCPLCKRPITIQNVHRRISDDENSKFAAIWKCLSEIMDPVLIFAQYRKVLRHLRLYIQSHRARSDVYFLEGSVSHRENVLIEFKKRGGVMLLCTSDSVAGIRFPAVRHILFAHGIVGNHFDVRAIEMQAIGRAANDNSSCIQVRSFVSAATCEESWWHDNHPSPRPVDPPEIIKL